MHEHGIPLCVLRLFELLLGVRTAAIVGWQQIVMQPAEFKRSGNQATLSYSSATMSGASARTNNILRADRLIPPIDPLKEPQILP